jgi:arylsulfatase A-like enzyme
MLKQDFYKISVKNKSKTQPYSKQTFSRGLSRRHILKYGFYGSLAAALSPCLWLTGCRKQRYVKRPNIILIILDTTRADHLSCYGYHRQTSPNIDRLAEESILYTRAIAPSSWTLPSHASLFTGKFTSSHGARYDPEGPLCLTDAITGPKEWRVYRARGLAQNEVTLAAILKQKGYTTGAVVAGPWLKKIFGLDKGFDYYDDNDISTLNGRPAKQVTSAAAGWIKQSPQKEFFLFLNYFDPHIPYSPPEDFAKAFLPKDANLDALKPTAENKNAVYDAEILYMDHYIGQLLKELKADNLYDNTWIIVTADHGELLGEHNIFGHGKHLYQEELHIPMLLKYPYGEVSPTRTELPIQLNDIFAIILERLGIALPQRIQASVPPVIGHPVLAEVYPLPVISKRGDWRAIFQEDLKFIWNSKGKHMLFNLKYDPNENVNIVRRDHQQAGMMMAQMEAYLKTLPKPGTPAPAQELDEDTKKALKSLGYVE